LTISNEAKSCSVLKSRCPECYRKFSKFESERFFKCYDKKCPVVLFEDFRTVVLGDFGKRERAVEPQPREERPYEPGS